MIVPVRIPSGFANGRGQNSYVSWHYENDTVPAQLSLFNGASWEITLAKDGTIGNLLEKLEERLERTVFLEYRWNGVIVLLDVDSSEARWELRHFGTVIMQTKLVRDQLAAGRPVSFQLLLLPEHAFDRACYRRVV